MTGPRKTLAQSLFEELLNMAAGLGELRSDHRHHQQRLMELQGQLLILTQSLQGSSPQHRHGQMAAPSQMELAITWVERLANMASMAWQVGGYVVPWLRRLFGAWLMWEAHVTGILKWLWPF
jgi:hypothetical protein